MSLQPPRRHAVRWIANLAAVIGGVALSGLGLLMAGVIAGGSLDDTADPSATATLAFVGFLWWLTLTLPLLHVMAILWRLRKGLGLARWASRGSWIIVWVGLVFIGWDALQSLLHGSPLAFGTLPAVPYLFGTGGILILSNAPR